MNDAEAMMARYLSGEITPDEAAQLRELCARDASARAELVEMIRVERSLAWLHHESDAGQFQDEVMMRVEPDTVESAAFVAGVIAKVRPAVPRFRTWQKALALAAAVTLLAGGVLFIDSLRLHDDAQMMRTAMVADTPHVAVVTSLSADTRSALSIGQSLAMGDFEIATGRVGLSFADGAQLVVDGPAKLSLLSPSRARLWSGKAAAHVPEGAQGFTVETPTVEVVDLGTEFGVSVDATGVSDVHVFRGEVEARLGGDEAQPGSLVSLTTAQGRRFSTDGITVDAVPLATDFPPPPSPSPDTPRTEGAVHFLQQPPVSVETGRLVSHEFILLFKERDSIDLDANTLVSYAKPGRYIAAHKLKTRIGQQRRVTSYLLHYDRTALAHSGALRREGRVTFPFPIVGVIHKRGALNMTDGAFGHPSVVYDKTSGRGPERGRKDASSDVIVFSRDRRTLDLNLAVAGDQDQIRVLVAMPGRGTTAEK